MITPSLMNADQRTSCKVNKISPIRQLGCIGKVLNSQLLEGDTGQL